MRITVFIFWKTIKMPEKNIFTTLKNASSLNWHFIFSPSQWLISTVSHFLKKLKWTHFENFSHSKRFLMILHFLFRFSLLLHAVEKTPQEGERYKHNIIQQEIKIYSYSYIDFHWKNMRQKAWITWNMNSA